jgi:tetratricopeptide (TPR) repeat protein
MHRIASIASWIVAAAALTAIAAWPAYVANGTNAARAASLPTPAPVHADYLERDRLIAFWERAHAEHRRGDMLSPTNLSAQYLQRYRERGDPGDVVRAMNLAQEALRAQPYGNSAAELALGSTYVALHRFADALAVTRSVERYLPGDPSVLVREASVDLELGRYDAASAILTRLRAQRQPERVPPLDVETLIVRYDELTGNLARARERFERVVAYGNARYDAPAQQRAWFWFRAGELAFEAGDNDGAIAAERRALDVFPNFAEANRMLARVLCSLQRWQECLRAASASAAVVPYPEVLGYEVDAQRALGDPASAAATDDLIRTIERIGNAQHVSDRLLAIYYSEHAERTVEAYAIAKRELLVRDDVYAEDTLAWAAAMDGRWAEAAARSRAALRYGTENALFRYHAGVVALHAGDREGARIRLRQALALNACFHPFYAQDARRRLADLDRAGNEAPAPFANAPSSAQGALR